MNPAAAPAVAAPVGLGALLFRAASALPLPMRFENVLRELDVILLGDVVQEEKLQIEAGQKRSGQVHVLHGRPRRVVPAKLRVGRRKDRSARIQGRGDTCLRDGDGLLFHHFVDCRTIVLLHLVEFIDATDAAVRQNQSAAFQMHFIRLLVAHYRCGETDARRPLARRILGALSNVGCLSQQLRLGHSWVSHQQHVQVTTHFHAVAQLLRAAPGQKQKYCLLHVLHPENLGRDRI
mmetsp:Transcript_380/g.772  ORF Transcript_380/g.772 Transcript_380/m.772 type:complete len:235 (-) Transcript_380:1318-2022(-)